MTEKYSNKDTIDELIPNTNKYASGFGFPMSTYEYYTRRRIQSITKSIKLNDSNETIKPILIKHKQDLEKELVIYFIRASKIKTDEEKKKFMEFYGITYLY